MLTTARRRSGSSPSAIPISTASTPTGQQLPYIDRFILEVVDGKLIPIKTGAGEADLQARRLVFKDYTFLKESEARATG